MGLQQVTSVMSTGGLRPILSILTVLSLSHFVPATKAQTGSPAANQLTYRSAAEGSFGSLLTLPRSSASDLFSNPVALQELGAPSVALGWSNLSSLSRRYSLTGATPVGENAAVAIGAEFAGVSDIDLRDRDEQRRGTGSTGVLSIGIGGSVGIGPGSIGGSVRYLLSTVSGADAETWGVALDLGGRVSFRERLTLSLLLKNVAGVVNASYRSGVHETIPVDARLGLSWTQPLEIERERVRLSPTGLQTEREIPPKRYIVLGAEVRSAPLDDDPVLGLGMEILPYQYELDRGIGVRLGASTRSEFMGGLFIDLPTLGTTDTRLSFGARNERYALGQQFFLELDLKP